MRSSLAESIALTTKDTRRSQSSQPMRLWLSLGAFIASLALPLPGLAESCELNAVAAYLTAMVELGESRDQALTALESCGLKAMPGLVAALSASDLNQRLEAVAVIQILLSQPEATSAWVDQSPELTIALRKRLQTDAEEQVRASAALALGDTMRLSSDLDQQEVIARSLLTVLESNSNLDVRINATYGLAAFQGDTKALQKDLIPFLTREEIDLQRAAARTLADWNQVEPLVEILQDHNHTSETKQAVAIGLRGVTAPTAALIDALVDQLTSANTLLKIEISTALRQIVDNAPLETGELLLPHLEALVYHLETSNSPILRNIVGTLAVTSDVISQANFPYSERITYLKVLEIGVTTLENNAAANETLQRELRQGVRSLQVSTSRWEEIVERTARIGFTTLLIHSLFWLGLVAVYPTSPQVQAIFFWNPRVRKIFGLGYVGLALTWIPFLRAKLFAPFRDNLLAEVGITEADDQRYFSGSDVILQKAAQRGSILEVIPDLQGQIVLEGESGSGKTMALKQLVRRSRRLVVFLPARRCAAGVIEAIRDRLHGPAQDMEFLQSLIYSGAIDICIDGLNEVAPDTRAKITLFAETYFRGNIAITTQPISGWQPPASTQVYHLQPLTADQIQAFLQSREPTLPPSAPVQGSQYEQACEKFLTQLQTDNLSNTAMIQILSNPMELTVVAQMIADGKQPDLLNLHQQQFDVMAKRYEYVNLNQPFPLEAFAEMAYQMRLSDTAAIPAEPWFKELSCLAEYRMVVRRQMPDSQDRAVLEWRFRHEKIRDFFIVQTFWGEENERPNKHIGDPRFRGVYLLLATQLPIAQALQLREKLLTYAVKTKDHTVSDRFIEILQTKSN